MRLHDLSITAFGPFVDTVHVDFDELAAGGLFLLTGDTGAGQDERARRRLLRALRRGPGRPAHRPTPAQRPGRRRRPSHWSCSRSASAGAPSGSPAPPPGSDPSERGTGTTPRPGPRRRRGAARRRVDRADQPARRGRPAGHRPARDDLRPVHPGGDAAAGTVPGVPARQLRRAPRRAAAAVPHPAVRGRRALAGRAARRAAAAQPDPPRPVCRCASTGSRRPPGSAYPRSGTLHAPRPRSPRTARSSAGPTSLC